MDFNGRSRSPMSPHSVTSSPRASKLLGIRKPDKPPKSDKPRKLRKLYKSPDNVTFPELYLIKYFGPENAARMFSQNFDEASKYALTLAKSQNPEWFLDTGSDSDSDSDSYSDSSSKFKSPNGSAITEYTEYMKQLFRSSPSSSLSQSSSSRSQSSSSRSSSSQSSSPSSSQSSSPSSESEHKSMSPKSISSGIGSPYMGGRHRKKNKNKKNTRKNKNTPIRHRSKKYTRRKKRRLKYYCK